MSLPQGRSYDQELESQLKNANLPPDIVGRPYRFGCQYNSHHVILTGTVVAISVTDTGGLCIEVSSRRFTYSTELWGFHFDGLQWVAHTNAPAPFDQIHGDLVFR